jgi:hypothetical protein
MSFGTIVRNFKNAAKFAFNEVQKISLRAQLASHRLIEMTLLLF